MSRRSYGKFTKRRESQEEDTTQQGEAVGAVAQAVAEISLSNPQSHQQRFDRPLHPQQLHGSYAGWPGARTGAIPPAFPQSYPVRERPLVHQYAQPLLPPSPERLALPHTGSQAASFSTQHMRPPPYPLLPPPYPRREQLPFRHMSSSVQAPTFQQAYPQQEFSTSTSASATQGLDNPFARDLSSNVQHTGMDIGHQLQVATPHSETVQHFDFPGIAYDQLYSSHHAATSTFYGAERQAFPTMQDDAPVGIVPRYQTSETMHGYQSTEYTEFYQPSMLGYHLSGPMQAYQPSENIPSYQPCGPMQAYLPSENIPSYQPSGPMQGYQATGTIPSYHPSGPMQGYQATGNIPSYHPSGPMQAYQATGNIQYYQPSGPMESYQATGNIQSYQPSGPMQGYQTTGNIQSYQPSGPMQDYQTTGNIPSYQPSGPMQDYQATGNIQSYQPSGTMQCYPSMHGYKSEGYTQGEQHLKFKQSGKHGKRKVIEVLFSEPLKVAVNHFQLLLTNDSTNKLYCYKVAITPAGLPKHLNREIFRNMIGANPIPFENGSIAYNGSDYLYSTRPLLDLSQNTMQKLSTTWQIAHNVSLPPEERQRDFSVEVKFDQVINLRLPELPSSEELETFCLALDTILRQQHCRREIGNFGRSFFPWQHDDQKRIGVNDYSNKYAAMGHYQTVKGNPNATSIAVDVAATVLSKGNIEVIELIPDNYLNRRLLDNEYVRFSKEILGLKIKATHLTYDMRPRTVIDVTEPASLLTFTVLDKSSGAHETYTVQKYYEKFHKPLKYPHLPCLQVHPRDRRIYYPVEVCKIHQDEMCKTRLTSLETKKMIELTKSNPQHTADRILEWVRTLKTEDMANNFHLDVSTEMTKVEGHQLDVPIIEYHKIFPNGRIGLYKSTLKDMLKAGRVLFYKTCLIRKWMIVSFVEVYTQILESFEDRFIMHARELRMFQCHLKPCNAENYDLRKIVLKCDDTEELRAEQFLQNLVDRQDPKPDVIVIFFPPERLCHNIYAAVKHFGDVNNGIVTQCVSIGRVNKYRDGTHPNSIGFFKDLLSKINIKLGGINRRISDCNMRFDLTEQKMFLGAVNSNIEDDYVFMIVGSIDKDLSRFATTGEYVHSRYTTPNMADLMRQQLRAFYSANRRYPEEIVYYREYLINKEKFHQVYLTEVNCLKQVCEELCGGSTKLTYIVCQKSHHTRLFLSSGTDEGEQEQFRNVQPGAVVDSIVTYPSDGTKNDVFYLCSHSNSNDITGRPTQYYVVHDDNNYLDHGHIYHLTFRLCFLNARSTRSTSIPVPLCYAILAAKRFAVLRIYRKRHPDPEAGNNLEGDGGDGGGGIARELGAVGGADVGQGRGRGAQDSVEAGVSGTGQRKDEGGESEDGKEKSEKGAASCLTPPRSIVDLNRFLTPPREVFFHSKKRYNMSPKVSPQPPSKRDNIVQAGAAAPEDLRKDAIKVHPTFSNENRLYFI